MKFGAQWRDFTAQHQHSMPPMFQEATLNYKKYKKISKDEDMSNDSIQRTLVADVYKTDAAFEHFMRIQHRPTFWKCCVLQPERPAGKTRDLLQTLYMYATFNTVCLYKICKRLDKRHGAGQFTRWYRSSLTARMYKFMSKDVQLLLGYNSRSISLDECPVCLESLASPECAGILLNCGHVMCQPCALSLLGVHRTKGTLHNKIAHGAHHNPMAAKCPICRDRSAFHSYHVIQGCNVI